MTVGLFVALAVLVLDVRPELARPCVPMPPSALARCAAAITRPRQRTLDALRDAVPDVCRSLAGELRAGATLADAVAAASAGAPPLLRDHLVRVAAGLRLGGDAAALLLPPPRGAEDLAALAACLQVASDGGSLTHVLERLARALDGERRQRREVAAQLAAPRASAAVLSVLPLVGALLSAGLGGDVLAFGRTPVGALCLAAGIVLDVTGVLWTSAIARRAVTRG